MTSTRMIVFIAGLGLLCATPATAQPPSPVAPPFSPYLNLLRGSGSPALNYYGLVRPTQSINQSVQAIQSNVTTLNEMSTAGGALPTTGLYVAGYQNHLGYFQNQRSAGGLNPGGTGGAMSPGVGIGQGGVGRPAAGGVGLGGAGIGNRLPMR